MAVLAVFPPFRINIPTRSYADNPSSASSSDTQKSFRFNTKQDRHSSIFSTHFPLSRRHGKNRRKTSVQGRSRLVNDRSHRTHLELPLRLKLIKNKNATLPKPSLPLPPIVVAVPASTFPSDIEPITATDNAHSCLQKQHIVSIPSPLMLTADFPVLPTPPLSPVTILPVGPTSDGGIDTGRVRRPPAPVRFPTAEFSSISTRQAFRNFPTILMVNILKEIGSLHLDQTKSSKWCVTCYHRDLLNIARVSISWHQTTIPILYSRLCIPLELDQEWPTPDKRSSSTTFTSASQSVISSTDGYRKVHARNQDRLNALIVALKRNNLALGSHVKTIEASHAQLAIEQEIAADGDRLDSRRFRSSLLDCLAAVIAACPNVERVRGLYFWCPSSRLDTDILTASLASRVKLQEKVWILTDSDIGVDMEIEREEMLLCPEGRGYQYHSQLTTPKSPKIGVPPPTRRISVETDRFLNMHLNWTELQTLVLHGTLQSSQNVRMTYRSVVGTFRSLPSLQHLYIGELPATAFSDRTLNGIPPVKSLRLDSLPGITDAGLSRFSRRDHVVTKLESLTLIGLEIHSVGTISRLINGPVLRKFVLIQTTPPALPPGADFADIIHHEKSELRLASPQLEFLHWDILVPSPVTAYLASEIAGGQAFPKLRLLRAPSDHDGTLQQVCRPMSSAWPKSRPRLAIQAGLAPKIKSENIPNKQGPHLCNPECRLTCGNNQPAQPGTRHKPRISATESCFDDHQGVLAHIDRLIEPYILNRVEDNDEMDLEWSEFILHDSNGPFTNEQRQFQETGRKDSASPDDFPCMHTTHSRYTRGLSDAQKRAEERIEATKNMGRPQVTIPQEAALRDVLKTILRVHKEGNEGVTAIQNTRAKGNRGSLEPWVTTKLPAIVVSVHFDTKCPEIRQLIVLPDYVGILGSPVRYCLVSDVGYNDDRAILGVKEMFEPGWAPAFLGPRLEPQIVGIDDGNVDSKKGLSVGAKSSLSISRSGSSSNGSKPSSLSRSLSRSLSIASFRRVRRSPKGEDSSQPELSTCQPSRKSSLIDLGLTVGEFRRDNSKTYKPKNGESGVGRRKLEVCSGRTSLSRTLSFTSYSKENLSRSGSGPPPHTQLPIPKMSLHGTGKINLQSHDLPSRGTPNGAVVLANRGISSTRNDGGRKLQRLHPQFSCPPPDWQSLVTMSPQEYRYRPWSEFGPRSGTSPLHPTTSILSSPPRDFFQSNSRVILQDGHPTRYPNRDHTADGFDNIPLSLLKNQLSPPIPSRNPDPDSDRFLSPTRCFTHPIPAFSYQPTSSLTSAPPGTSSSFSSSSPSHTLQVPTSKRSVPPTRIQIPPSWFEYINDNKRNHTGSSSDDATTFAAPKLDTRIPVRAATTPSFYRSPARRNNPAQPSSSKPLSRPVQRFTAAPLPTPVLLAPALSLRSPQPQPSRLSRSFSSAPSFGLTRRISHPWSTTNNQAHVHVNTPNASTNVVNGIVNANPIPTANVKALPYCSILHPSPLNNAEADTYLPHKPCCKVTRVRDLKEWL